VVVRFASEHAVLVARLARCFTAALARGWFEVDRRIGRMVEA
jgi:hypothetical protein